MKIVKIIFLLIFLQSHNLIFSQGDRQEKCGTPDFDTAYVDTLPWYGNNDFLVHFYDSIRAIYPGLNPDTAANNLKLYGMEGVENAGIRIPVQFWVYDNPNIQFPGFYLNLQGIIDVLNYQFRANSSPIRFYALCDIKYNVPAVSSTSVTSMTWDDAISLNLLHKTPFALNIHIVENLDDGLGVYFPWLPYAIFVRRFECLINSGSHDVTNLLSHFNNAPTFTHETGHFLGLFHTHQFGPRWRSNNPCSDGVLCFREAVTRYPFCEAFCPGPPCLIPFNTYSDCQKRGVFLCDTHADYDCGPSYVDNNCTYNDWKNDWRADQYQPDARNIMGYGCDNGLGICESHFTDMQKFVMLYGCVQKGIPFWFQSPFNGFDVYEPDNNSIMSREILFGISNEQTHSFHMENSFSPLCDEDWLKFTMVGTNPSGIINIETKEDPTSLFTPNTILWLYDSNLNLVATDDDGNGNGFSKITVRELPPSTYFIKVTCKSNSISSIAKYKISVVECVPYDDCVSGVANSGEFNMYAALNIFTAPCPSTTYIINSGATIIMKAEKEIILGNGFNAFAGSDFLATIEKTIDCADDNTQRVIPKNNPYTRSSTNDMSYYYNPLPNKEAIDSTIKDWANLFPNPSNGNFTLSYQIPGTETGTMEIYDMMGKELLSYTLTGGKNTLDINATELDAGIYFYTAWSGTKRIAADKIVVIK